MVSPRLSLLLLVTSVAAVAAYWAGVTTARRSSAAAVAAQSELAPWRSAFENEVRLAREDRVKSEESVRALTEQMIRMQTQIVYLDTLAARLTLSTELGGEFDFSRNPALGGPEELPVAAIDQPMLIRTTDLLSKQIEDRLRQFDVLESLLVQRRLSENVRPEGLPVASAYVSSRFGERIDPFTGRMAHHKGIDFAGRPGTEVVAVAAGIVIWSGPRDGYGQTIDIDHGNDRVTRYAHNAENLVTVGDIVTRGQPIARLGDSGRTTGPNLHFEVLRAGKAVDPSSYMK